MSGWSYVFSKVETCSELRMAQGDETDDYDGFDQG